MALSENEELELLELEEQESKTQPQKQATSWADIPGNAIKDAGGILSTVGRAGQGLIDLPKDVYNTGKGMMGGQSFSDTPIGQDVNTVGGAALDALPHGVNENGSYKIEPGSIFRQYQDLAAEPLKHIPGKIGETMKQAYPENPLMEHPLNSALALAPLAGPAMNAAREIPAVDEGLNAASKGIRENYVAPNARRALGKFPMKMPIEEANQVGLDAMDQGVIKNPLTNPLNSSKKAMLGRAEKLNDSLGENIGNFLKGQGDGIDVGKAVDELDKVKEQFYHDPAVVAKVERAKKLLMRNSDAPQYQPASTEVIHGNSTTETVPNGFTEIPAGAETKSIFKGFSEYPSKTVDDAVVDPLTGQKSNISSQEPYGDIYKGTSIVGNSQDISSPRSQIVGKSKDIEIPGGKTIVQRGGKPINWTGIEKSPQMEFTKANKIKSMFQKKVNYFSDAANQESGKAIAGNLRNSIDMQLDELTKKLGNPEGMQDFKANKKMFGSTRKMEDVLTGQVNRDSRNMPISPISLMVGSAEAVAGGALKGTLTGLVAQWTKQYGSATAASMMNDVSKALSSHGVSTAPSSLGIAGPVSKSTEKQPAPHGNMVSQDGKNYKWNGAEYVEMP